jgi:lysophospholipase L1-like esterase
MRSRLSFKPFLLCLIVLLLLGIISFIPSFTLGDISIKTIDILSAVRDDVSPAPFRPEPMFSDTVTESDSLVIVEQNSDENRCAEGLTCIEDYSDNNNGLTAFFDALSVLKSKRSIKPLRVAFYGDSFIEGDVFCGSVRDTLQNIFGGRGVGFVPVTSHIIGFRNTIKQSYENWSTYSIVTKRDTLAKYEIGPAGYCFKPKSDNWLEYRASKQRYLREFQTLRLFYKNKGQAKLNFILNDTLKRNVVLPRSARLKEWKVETKKAKKVELAFEHAESLEVYGASFEGEPGIYIDNFAVRGNSGVSLDLIPAEMLKTFNQFRDYKLILLQYGLNVVNTDSARYAWYAGRMITVIEKLKKVFPEASIVLLSVSDRSTKVDGKYKTLNTIPALRNTQRYIAQQTNIAFWDLYEAMGGEDSMVRFVSADPALGAKDYTHLTFKGGKKLAAQLVGSLLYEFNQYESEKQLP